VYPDIDLFTLPPKIFGSLCFVHNHSPRKIKLDSSFLKEIFLGHSRTQKGYKYFCPSIGRDILSADVTFFESKLGINISPSTSEDDYDYLFYRETSLDSDESTSENVTNKDSSVSGSDSGLYTPNSSCSCANTSLSTKCCVRIK